MINAIPALWGRNDCLIRPFTTGSGRNLVPKPLGTMMLQIHYRLMAVLNAIGTSWVAGITVLISCDILGRALFNSPLIGVPEIVKVSVVAIVWLQMAHTLKIGGHLRSDAILNRLSRRGRSIVDLISYALGAVIFGLIVYSGWDTMIMAWELGEFEGEEPVRVPTYPIRSIVLLGAGLTSLQFLFMLGKVISEMIAHRRAEGE